MREIRTSGSVGAPGEQSPGATRLPELDPKALPVEVGEGDEELGERGALAMEELGEVGGEIACGGHDASIARDFCSSPGARIRVRKRERVRVREMPSRAFDAPQARSATPGAAFPHASSSLRSSDGETRQAPRRREIGARRRTRARGWPEADLVTALPLRGHASAAALLVAQSRSPSGSSPTRIPLFVQPLAPLKCDESLDPSSRMRASAVRERVPQRRRFPLSSRATIAAHPPERLRRRGVTSGGSGSVQPAHPGPLPRFALVIRHTSAEWGRTKSAYARGAEPEGDRGRATRSAAAGTSP